MAVLVVGSVALDTVVTPFGKADEALGGSATYFSLAASYFDHPRLVAVVGEDFPEEHKQTLRRCNVDTEGLEVRAGKTFRWAGKYGFDLNQRETLSTHLNVFEHFHPRLPGNYRESEYVFLGNIHPRLQLEVLDQVSSPVFVACDTMNFWIENERETLCEVIKRVDAIVLNDSEARELACEPNLAKAARNIQELGCLKVIIKKGEHGCLFFTPHSHFSAPAYPLESVYDPTGAGDSFAGGFMGYLARHGKLDELSIRRAIIYGSVLASFTVERFGVQRLLGLSEPEVLARYKEFLEITRFDS
ncbi:MAG: sugar kinase [Candidatus Abyssobacteria bacterium SURF_17]|jgi:sugar/nucleoside kinase (ribokinase family)|uniref:Sugar kinase n=1 Tax=Candidatus Abyssobacteria bacterium SURF_17 TaxID=2093361 RepID=A0A419EZL0_9BACT|nr:MAG: sugar kinase [Candidatus Abyssubacteria bacterium SURF_17]